MSTTDQMFLYLQNKNKNIIQNSIYYSYMTDTKIPFSNNFKSYFYSLNYH